MDVLIVSFNAKEQLWVTLATLLAHAPQRSRLELRVSVYDNASSDGSADMVADHFPQVTVLRADTNRGFARAMNALATRSSAEYLLLLNSDVIVERDLISPLVTELNARPDAVAVGPRLVYPGGAIQYSANHFPTLTYEYAKLIKGTRVGRLLRGLFDSEAVVRRVHQIAETERRSLPWEPDFVWATCWLLRRSDVVARGLFDETFPLYDEDLDFCMRARAHGRTMLYVPGVELVHLGGTSSTSDSKRRLMITARRRYYRRHYGRLAAMLYVAGLDVIPMLVRGVAAVPVSASSRIV